MRNIYLKYSKTNKRIMLIFHKAPLWLDVDIAHHLEIDVKLYRHILRRFSCDHYDNKKLHTIFKNEKNALAAIDYLENKYMVIKALIGE